MVKVNLHASTDIGQDYVHAGWAKVIMTNVTTVEG